MKKLLPVIITVLLLAIMYVLFIWQPGDSSMQGAVPGLSGSGLPSGGDFTLQSLDGPVALKDYRGKVVLIYFGYTMCPDICPTSLSMMAGALAQLKPEQLQQVQGLFISVDPQRDTLQRLDEYTRYFHPAIKGLTDKPERIAELAKRYGAVYQKVVLQSATDYVVDHSSETYVVDPQGRLVERLPHGTLPEQILAAIRKYLQDK